MRDQALSFPTNVSQLTVERDVRKSHQRPWQIKRRQCEIHVAESSSWYVHVFRNIAMVRDQCVFYRRSAKISGASGKYLCSKDVESNLCRAIRRPRQTGL